ncbi:hypothetical protein RND81_14G085100 [Saponaria officinalis]|uniref:Uncharacterized protein n=1 Tax=Saponaria officinalis TaxID=3572 RepID=A0AAW1GMH2_SAPOF
MADLIDLTYDGPLEDDIVINNIADFNDLLINLEENDPARTSIIELFRGGLGPIGEHVNIFTVYRNQFRNPIVDGKIFKLIGLNLSLCTFGSNKGEIAFYGDSKEELLEIIRIGFSGGTNIRLSKSNFSSISAFRCVPDNMGIYHVLVCRLHVGRAYRYDGQILELSTSQKPTINFDIGATHREFLVYDCHKNSYVLPMFIVSFGSRKFKAVHGEVHELFCQPENRTPLNVLSVFVSMLIQFDATPAPPLTTIVDNYEINGNADELVHELQRLQNFDRIRNVFDAYFSPLLESCICIATGSTELRDALAAMIQ